MCGVFQIASIKMSVLLRRLSKRRQIRNVHYCALLCTLCFTFLLSKESKMLCTMVVDLNKGFKLFADSILQTCFYASFS